MIVSDAPNCGVTYDRHYDNRNSFIIQATGGSANNCCVFNLFCIERQKMYNTSTFIEKL